MHGVVARYDPRPLREPAPADVTALVAPARAQRLVLYLGAGVSIPWPACGPRGNQVADVLKPIVAELLGTNQNELHETDLESLAGRIQRDAPDRLRELKERAATAWLFRDIEPTFGHEAIALLIREGLIRVVSANWDCGVENGGRQVAVSIEGVSQDIDLLRLPADALPLFKVHGCARRPATLVLTRDEVDEPSSWARARVQDALAAGTVVFIGLGTVGAYVGKSVEELVALWIEQGTNVRVVDPGGLSDAWKEVLGDRAEDVEVRRGSDEYLDDLLRAVVARALSEVGEVARNIDRHEQQLWSRAIVEGHQRLMAALRNLPADAIVRWWRDGASNGLFVFDRAGQAALLCVAQLAEGDIVAEGMEGNLVVRSDQAYFEIAARPQQHWTVAARSARARIERRRRSGRYTPGMPVTVAIAAATGAFPAPDAPPDIAGADADPSDIAAGGRDSLRIVRAEDALDGRLAS